MSCCLPPCHPATPAEQIAKWIGERLAAPYELKYMLTDRDFPLAKSYQEEKIPDE